MGRWINRDPIGELGGANLYRMVENDAINSTDYLGLISSLHVNPGATGAALGGSAAKAARDARKRAKKKKLFRLKSLLPVAREGKSEGVRGVIVARRTCQIETRIMRARKLGRK